MINSGNKPIINVKNGTQEIGKVYNGTTLIYRSLPIALTEDMVARAPLQNMVMEAETCLYNKLKTLN